MEDMLLLRRAMLEEKEIDSRRIAEVRKYIGRKAVCLHRI